MDSCFVIAFSSGCVEETGSKGEAYAMLNATSFMLRGSIPRNLDKSCCPSASTSQASRRHEVLFRQKTSGLVQKI